MTESLGTRARKGVIWSFIDAIGVRAVQFGIGIILARLLLPEEFGMIGMLTIFIAVAQTFLVSGFGSAIIQKESVTEEDTSSVFYFNIVIGLLLACLFYISAPYIAGFYNQSKLAPMTRAMSLVVIFSSFSVVQTALLTRNINFKTQTKVSLLGGIASGTIGVTMAYKGFGVWSLVGQQISAAFFKSCLLWVFNSWRPRFTFSIDALRTMFAFGSRLLSAGILNQVFENIYFVVIGRFFSPAALGFYTRAKMLQEIPTLTLSAVVGRVSFPLFSTIQDDNERMRSGLQKALCLLVFINTPLMIGLAVVAEPLILLLLTEKWLPCVPYLQLLTVLGVIYPVHLLNLNVLMAMGRSDLFLRLEIIKKFLIILGIVCTYRIGILAMIFSQIVISFIGYFLNTYYNKKFLDYGAIEQFRDLFWYLIAAAAMGLCVHTISYIKLPNLTTLLAQVFIGVVIYVLLTAGLKLTAFNYCWAMINKQRMD